MQTEQAGQSVGRDHAIDGERACTFDKNQQREDKQGEGYARTAKARNRRGSTKMMKERFFSKRKGLRRSVATAAKGSS
ncbi:MAG TPA: hypothetical protein VMD25_03365 [Acidobacteriaceae bacterium]|nr:hypothetical protein [Acidobacteriaceae bacterium]